MPSARRMMKILMGWIKYLVGMLMYMIFCMIALLDVWWGTFSCSVFYNPFSPLLASYVPLSYALTSSVNLYHVWKMDISYDRQAELSLTLSLFALLMYIMEATLREAQGEQTASSVLQVVVVAALHAYWVSSPRYRTWWPVRYLCVALSRGYFSRQIVLKLQNAADMRVATDAVMAMYDEPVHPAIEKTIDASFLTLYNLYLTYSFNYLSPRRGRLNESFDYNEQWRERGW